MAQARVPMFFAVSRYLRGKYFDVVWGYRPSGIPQNQSFEPIPQNQSYGASVF